MSFNKFAFFFFFATLASLVGISDANLNVLGLGDCAYELQNVYRGDEFISEFQFEKFQEEKTSLQGFANTTTDKASLKDLIYLNGNKFVVHAPPSTTFSTSSTSSSSPSSSAPRKSRSTLKLTSKKQWKSGLFVMSVNHVPEGECVRASVTFHKQTLLNQHDQCKDNPQLREVQYVGKLNFITEKACRRNRLLGLPSVSSGLSSPLSSLMGVRWSGKDKVFANSVNAAVPPLAGCSTYIFVFEVLPETNKCNVWTFPLSQAPLDLTNEKPNPSLWMHKPKIIHLKEIFNNEENDEEENEEEEEESNANIKENDSEEQIEKEEEKEKEEVEENKKDNGHIKEEKNKLITQEKEKEEKDEGFAVSIELSYITEEKKLTEEEEKKRKEKKQPKKVKKEEDDCEACEEEEEEEEETDKNCSAYWEVNYLKVYEKVNNDNLLLSLLSSFSLGELSEIFSCSSSDLLNILGKNPTKNLHKISTDLLKDPSGCSSSSSTLIDTLTKQLNTLNLGGGRKDNCNNKSCNNRNTSSSSSSSPCGKNTSILPSFDTNYGEITEQTRKTVDDLQEKINQLFANNNDGTKCNKTDKCNKKKNNNNNNNSNGGEGGGGGMRNFLDSNDNLLKIAKTNLDALNLSNFLQGREMRNLTGGGGRTGGGGGGRNDDTDNAFPTLNIGTLTNSMQNNNLLKTAAELPNKLLLNDYYNSNNDNEEKDRNTYNNDDCADKQEKKKNNNNTQPRLSDVFKPSSSSVFCQTLNGRKLNSLPSPTQHTSVMIEEETFLDKKKYNNNNEESINNNINSYSTNFSQRLRRLTAVEEEEEKEKEKKNKNKHGNIRRLDVPIAPMNTYSYFPPPPPPVLYALPLTSRAINALGMRVEGGKNLIGNALLKTEENRMEMQQLLRADLYTKAQNMKNTAADIFSIPTSPLSSSPPPLQTHLYPYYQNAYMQKSLPQAYMYNNNMKNNMMNMNNNMMSSYMHSNNIDNYYEHSSTNNNNSMGVGGGIYSNMLSTETMSGQDASMNNNNYNNINNNNNFKHIPSSPSFTSPPPSPHIIPGVYTPLSPPSPSSSSTISSSSYVPPPPPSAYMTASTYVASPALPSNYYYDEYGNTYTYPPSSSPPPPPPATSLPYRMVGGYGPQAVGGIVSRFTGGESLVELVKNYGNNFVEKNIQNLSAASSMNNNNNNNIQNTDNYEKEKQYVVGGKIGGEEREGEEKHISNGQEEKKDESEHHNRVDDVPVRM